MNTPYRRGPDLFWPIILIGAGIIFLLSNLGVITGNPWPIIWNLWPVLLIVIGLDILFGRRSMLGGLIGAALALLLVIGVIFLLILQPNLPGLSFGGNDLHVSHNSAPLGSVQSAGVSIDYGSGSNRLYALGDSDQLVDANINYYGNLTFDVSASNNQATIQIDSHNSGVFFGTFGGGEKQDIGLNTRPVYDLNLSLGSGGADLDLSKLNMSGGRIDVGSGSVALRLPSTGKFTLRIDGGSGSLNIRVPSSLALRVEYDHGSGGFSASSRLKTFGDGVFETDGFSAAQNAITLVVNGGSGSISVSDSE
jgi:hypothetical protein